MESIDSKLKRLRRAANWLIYSSVILGVALLVQLYALMVPSWLLYSILSGWILYLVVSIAVATGHSKAYPAALVLSIVTLGCFSATTRAPLSRRGGPDSRIADLHHWLSASDRRDLHHRIPSGSGAETLARQNESSAKLTKGISLTESIKTDSAK